MSHRQRAKYFTIELNGFTLVEVYFTCCPTADCAFLNLLKVPDPLPLIVQSVVCKTKALVFAEDSSI